MRRIVYGIAAAGLLAVALGVTTLAAASDRGALWGVVRACLATHALTGAAFPCLDVDVRDGADRGFVVLRPPVGAPDTVLVPTRRVVGVEDPWVVDPDAPNYFAQAWRARSFVAALSAGDGRERDAAVAVNSEPLRSQDQLHIHIGCLDPEVGKALAPFIAAARVGEWKRAAPPEFGGEFWILRTGRSSLDGVDPFRLVGEGPAATARERARTSIAVTKPWIGGRREFVVLASRNGGVRAETVVDLACAAAKASAIR